MTCLRHEPRTPEEIVERFGLPFELATAYAETAAFFVYLRETRTAVVHGGSRVDTVFATERGFCVNPTGVPFNGFEQWDESHRYNANLVTLLSWLADVIVRTIGACSAVTAAFASVIQFPPEVAPGYRVFVRAPTTPYLYEMLEIQAGRRSPFWTL